MVKYLLVSAILACFFVLATSTGAYRPRNGLGPHRRLYPRRTPRRIFQCNKNEVWSTCTAAACRPKTCKEVGFSIPCPDLARNGTCPSGPGCICIKDYARNSEGICVPIKFCPSCGGDFNAKPGCGNCNPLCTNYDRDDIVCTQECRYNACDCKEGYVLDETCNKCVEPSQCPPRIKCNRNEVYEVCPSNCPPRTCGINDAAVSCAVSLPFGDPKCPPPTCRCKDGYYRNHKGHCVLWKNCPKCRRPNEVYDPCPSTCPPIRCDVDPALVLCQVQPSLGDAACKPACRCADGFRRNQTGICIPEEQCPKCLKPYQVFDPCLSCPPKRCDVDERVIRCAAPLKVGDPRCESGCRCIDGYKMNSDGDCIPEDQCPPRCDFNEVYSNCIPNDCKPKTCSQLGTKIKCPIQAAVCRQGCICKEGHVRNEDEVCVPIEQCPPKCNLNEIYSDCIPNDCKPKTCSQLGTKIKCPIQAAVCRQGCICKEGHVMNEDGVCVPIEQCPPKCNLNEVYSDCIPNDCQPKSCSQNGTDFECPIHDAVCRQGCICKEGHVRNEDGVCVPLEECTPQCPAYEEYSDCIQNDCFPQNCTQLGFPLDCPEVEAAYCKEGCICVDGYMRDATGKCIPMEKCPSCGGDTNKESGCGVYCNQRCSDLGKPPGACIDVCYENACNCRKGFYLDERSGNCVPPEQCPSKCPANEEYCDCIQNKCEAQNCTQLGFPIDCPQVEVAVCKQGCVCKSGYLRDHKGYCIPKEKCPSCRGDRNQVAGCGVYCNQRCRDIGKEPNFCIQVCYENACSCRKGLYLDENSGFCVKAEECSPQCPENEFYSTCTQGNCSPENCTQVGFPIACPFVAQEYCKKGCLCKQGFARNDKGVCIPSEQCPCCRGDSNARPGCGGYCNQRCSDIGKEPRACTLICEINGCDCKPGFYFDDKKNRCVKPENCSLSTPSCGKNEKYNNCTNAIFGAQTCKELRFPLSYTDVQPEKNPRQCPSNEVFSDCINGGCSARNCTQYGKLVPCVKIDPRYCIAGCVCKEDYLRDCSGKCVLAKNCPEACNGPNEEFSRCSWDCPPQTCDSLGKDYNCPIQTTDNCQPACRCKQGFCRNKHGQCVSEKQCCGSSTTIAPICGRNEVYEDCKNSVCRAKYCTELGFPLDCRSGCKTGCVCRHGYVRDGKGNCILEQYCPSCGGDKNAVSGCGQNCGRHCSDIGQGPVACRAICKLNSCDCKEGFYYCDKAQRCVRKEECGVVPTRCPVNERHESCPGTTCEPEYCNQLGYHFPCPEQNGNVTCSKKPGCVCIEGYVRDNNGKCIPKNTCPACGGDAYARSGCGVNCGKTCRELGKGPRPCIKICYVNACDCLDGYYFDAHQKKCVLPGQCTDKCDKNEMFEDCTNPTCKAETCTELGFPLDCKKTCKKGCICQNGYVRDPTGACVPAAQCPSCGGDKNAQKGCGFNCGKRCPNNYINPKFCPRIQCQPDKCDCKDGFYYDINTQSCVTLGECSPRCNEQNNEVYDPCVNGGCGWRNCSQLGGPKLCIDPITCNKGCKCKDGYYRLDDGTCVPKSQCPNKQCKGPNEHFNCGSACDNECSHPEYKIDCPIKNIKCVPKCYCNKGFARNENGICIPESDCPIKCEGANEHYACGPACDNVCGKKESKNNCPYENIKCNPKCYCNDGFARNPQGVCVPVNQCPKQCKGPNEHFNCGSACDNECSHPEYKIDCPIKNIKCVPKCYCNKGFARNEKGICIPESNCPIKCEGANEHYECGPACDNVCGKKESKNNCPYENIKCNPKCYCNDGFARNPQGVCVPVNQCPKTCRGPNEHHDCGPV